MSQAAAMPRMLKVLHIHSGNIIGGVESLMITFTEFAGTCPELQQQFALAFDGPFANALRTAGATVYVLPQVQLRNPFSVLRSRRRFRKLIKEYDFDAVISHSPWCQVIFAPVARRLSIPLIYWMHNDSDGHWLQQLASRNSPDLTICNSAFTRSTLPKIYPSSPSQIIHPPLNSKRQDDSDRDRLRHELGASGDTVVIFMASRMEAWKGHFNLLCAAAQIRTKMKWVVWIAGSPQTPAETKYFESVKAEGVRVQINQQVRFLGYRNDVPALMRAADIFCHPNAEPEPFGLVFVEALQAGVPVVTYAMGGPQEILDQSCGILVTPGDIPGLSAALVRLIEDVPLRAKLGAAGPARAKSLFDPAQQIRRVYEVVLPHCNRK